MTANEFKQQCDEAVERFMDGLYTTEDVVFHVHQASEKYKREEAELTVE